MKSCESCPSLVTVKSGLKKDSMDGDANIIQLLSSFLSLWDSCPELIYLVI